MPHTPWRDQARQAEPSAGDRHPVPASDLSEADLLRELAHLHATRHETFLHASTPALIVHSERQRALEDEYLRRHPGREIDPRRLRTGRPRDEDTQPPNPSSSTPDGSSADPSQYTA